jgi:hypothetical protein
MIRVGGLVSSQLSLVAAFTQQPISAPFLMRAGGEASESQNHHNNNNNITQLSFSTMRT